jgi:hypothetical protein
MTTGHIAIDVASDVFISLIMCWLLHNSKSEFTSSVQLTLVPSTLLTLFRTNHIIKKLVSVLFAIPLLRLTAVIDHFHDYYGCPDGVSACSVCFPQPPLNFSRFMTVAMLIVHLVQPQSLVYFGLYFVLARRLYLLLEPSMELTKSQFTLTLSSPRSTFARASGGDWVTSSMARQGPGQHLQVEQ